MVKLCGIFIQKISKVSKILLILVHQSIFLPRRGHGQYQMHMLSFSDRWRILNFCVSLEMSKELEGHRHFFLPGAWWWTFLSDSSFLSESSLQFCLPPYLWPQFQSLGLPVKAHLLQKQEVCTCRPAACTEVFSELKELGVLQQPLYAWAPVCHLSHPHPQFGLIGSSLFLPLAFSLSPYDMPYPGLQLLPSPASDN